jgi:hypothetical protein
MSFVLRALALLFAAACGGTAPAAAEPAPKPIPSMPMEGYVERRADASCWYARHAGEPMAPVASCPPTTARQPTTGSLKPPPADGYLEKIVADGTCWWSRHVPYECPKGATCKPNPTVTQVLCP